MEKYPKIQTVFKRNEHGQLVLKFSRPEFHYLWLNDWSVTEKVDGMNVRIMWNGNTVQFGGRTDRAQMPVPLMERLVEKFPDDTAFREQFDEPPVCLYCEGYGDGIQKGGGKYRAGQDVVLFDVKVGTGWLRRESVEDIGIALDLDVVPYLGTLTLQSVVPLTDGGLMSAWGDFPAEGIVATPVVPLLDRQGKRIITKLKTKDQFAEGEVYAI